MAQFFKEKIKFPRNIVKVKFFSSYQLQPNADVPEVIFVAPIGFEGLSALLQKTGKLLLQKLSREALLHCPDSSSIHFNPKQWHKRINEVPLEKLTAKRTERKLKRLLPEPREERILAGVSLDVGDQGGEEVIPVRGGGCGGGLAVGVGGGGHGLSGRIAPEEKRRDEGWRTKNWNEPNKFKWGMCILRGASARAPFWQW